MSWLVTDCPSTIFLIRFIILIQGRLAFCWTRCLTTEPAILQIRVGPDQTSEIRRDLMSAVHGPTVADGRFD